MALKTFVTGEVLTAADVNLYLVNSKFAQKTATESVTSSTAVQDDDELFVDVEANSIYELMCVLKYDGATAGDFRFTFTGPAGGGMTTLVHRLSTGAAASSDDAIVEGQTFAGEDVAGALGSGTNCFLEVRGLVGVAGTAGTFRLRWAQGTSSGTATRLFAGSYICLRRVE